MRYRLSAICILLACAWVMVFVMTRGDEEGMRSDLARWSGGTGTQRSSLEEPNAESDGSASDIEFDDRDEVVGSNAFRLSGVVIDSITEAPVAAVLRCSGGDGSWTTTKAAQGRFSLRCAPRETIQVRASGYRARRIEVGDCSELTIHLDAESTAQLHLLTDLGEPLAGVPVQWHSANSPLRVRSGKELTLSRDMYRGESVIEDTDDVGVSTIAAGCGMAATIDFDGQACLPSLRVNPGERRLLVVPARVTRVLLVDFESRAPLENLELVFYWPSISRSLARVLHTDASGHVSISECGDGVIVGLPRAREDLELIGLGGQGVYQDALDASSVRIDFLEREDPVVLGVRRLEGVVHLIDASTLLPVTAPVRATFRTPEVRSLPDGSRVPRSVAYSSRDSLAPTSEKLHAVSGKLRLGRKLRGESSAALDSSSNWELVLVVEGYAPAKISLAGVHDLGELDGKNVMLERATQRRLHIVMSDGAPFSELVTVFDPKRQLQLLRQSSASSGLYGPFDWTGGDLIARTGAHEWILTSNELAASEVLERVLPVASGTIRVTGVPTPECATRLLAKRGSALGEGEFHVSLAEDGVCIFENLSPGRYVVGPEDWVFGAALHSIQLPDELGNVAEVRAQQVRVSPGGTVTLDWNPAWMVVGAITGRVQVLGPGAGSAKLLPVYVDSGADMDLDRGADVRLMVSNRTPELPWNEDDEYVLNEGDSLPGGIAVCLSKGTSWGGLQDFYVDRVILPGESATIETFELVLRWDGPPFDGESEVTLVIDGLKTKERYLVPHHYLRDRRRWNGEHDLTYAALPRRTATVWIGGVDYHVSPVAGQSRLELVVGPVAANQEGKGN